MAESAGRDAGRVAPALRSALRGSGQVAQRRRLLTAGVATTVALAALAGFFAWRQYGDGKQHALNELDARVVLASTVFDTYFSGELSTLRSIAASPPVVSGSASAMRSYFRRLRPAEEAAFTGGIGWIDRNGRVVASSTPTRSGPAINVADRGYFRAVVASGKPYISGGLVSRRGRRRLIVMAVPTSDGGGEPNGVLAGALLLKQSAPNKQSIDLGYQGVVVIDRSGHEVTAASFPRPANAALVARMRTRKTEMLADTRGLSGSSGRVVVYATSPLPGWITAIDRSPGSVFATARRVLALELSSIVAAAVLIVGLLVWFFRRSNRHALIERQRSEIAAELTRSLADAYSPGEVAEALAVALAESVPGAATLVALPAADGSALELLAVQGLVPPTLHVGDPALLAPLVLAFEQGRIVRLEGHMAVAAEVPELQRASGRRIAAVYAAPIVRQERKLGAIALLLGDARPLTIAAEAGVAAHLEQAAQALGRTLRQERDHEVAVELQRSLLPEGLPSSDDVSFAARYHAGGAGVEVGGDWYDAVRRPDGLLHVSVGDVAGRGIHAATLMAQLRNAFRAYAFDCSSPAEITRRLLRHVPDGGMVTTVCLTLDPYTRRLGYSLAGHPPALLLNRTDGTVSRLGDAGAPPLGFATAAAIGEQWLTLSHPAAILAYTDGLIERRGVNVDDGIRRITSVLASSHRRSSEQLADALLATTVDDPSIDDDTALLVIDTPGVPARVHLRVAADPKLMSSLRHRLDSWMTLRGIRDSERRDAVLALHEACINTIEHGYQLGAGTIILTLEHHREKLNIQVEDNGSWRPPTPDPNRGRGLHIIETTMHTSTIDHDRNGTRVTLEQHLPQNTATATEPPHPAPIN